jgi:hypothetical protein
MIKEMYKSYFQKSYTFLYPQLGFKRTKDPKPKNVYVHWPEVFSMSDRKLVCIYERENSSAWRDFERDKLLKHHLFDQVVPLENNMIAYVFDMNPIASDYDLFIKGKYSMLSKNAKRNLSNYYGIHTPEWVYIESFIFPKKYFKHYAKILEIGVEQLEEVGELCDKYNQERETFTNQKQQNDE